MTDFETQAREIVVNLYLGEHYSQKEPSWRNQLKNPEIASALEALLALHQAALQQVVQQVKPLDRTERWEYERFKNERATAIEDYHEFGKAPVGSPERLAAYISQLSLHNLKQGAKVLKEWRDEAVEQAQEAVRIDETRYYAQLLKLNEQSVVQAALDGRKMGTISLRKVFEYRLKQLHKDIRSQQPGGKG